MRWVGSGWSCTVHPLYLRFSAHLVALHAYPAGDGDDPARAGAGDEVEEVRRVTPAHGAQLLQHGDGGDAAHAAAVQRQNAYLQAVTSAGNIRVAHIREL
eukprot:1187396-Prorocentrum_minimum.AAC.1